MLYFYFSPLAALFCILFSPHSPLPQLPMVNNLTEVNPELAQKYPDMFHELMEAYSGDVMNVDLYVGGMLESRDGPGELFRAIIKEQFQRLRDADRFWFENTENE